MDEPDFVIDAHERCAPIPLAEKTGWETVIFELDDEREEI